MQRVLTWYDFVHASAALMGICAKLPADYIVIFLTQDTVFYCMPQQLYRRGMYKFVS